MISLLWPVILQYIHNAMYFDTEQLCLVFDTRNYLLPAHESIQKGKKIYLKISFKEFLDVSCAKNIYNTLLSLLFDDPNNSDQVFATSNESKLAVSIQPK